MILRVYLPAVEQAVSGALSTLRKQSKPGGAPATASTSTDCVWDVDCEARVVSALVFLQQFVTYLPARHLMDHLQASNQS